MFSNNKQQFLFFQTTSLLPKDQSGYWHKFQAML